MDGPSNRDARRHPKRLTTNLQTDGQIRQTDTPSYRDTMMHLKTVTDLLTDEWTD